MIEAALQFWNAISGKVESAIKDDTRNTFRCERYKVTTAPNGTTMGVTLPMGSNEIFLPYSQEVSNATVGRSVLVVWWGSMSNAKVYYYADGYGGMSDYKIYDSVKDLGLEAGSATITTAFTALGQKAILITNAGDFVIGENGVPSIYGTVEIVRHVTGRAYIYFHGKGAANGDYRMYLVGDTNQPTKTWVSVALSAYPVGAIYISTESTSPASLFGGSWTRITGRFLLAATDGGSSGASQAAGNTGGAATHTLSTSEMPSHSHGSGSDTHNFLRAGAIYRANVTSGSNVTYAMRSPDTTVQSFANTANAGSGGAHNNMPPWLAVYIWKRTS